MKKFLFILSFACLCQLTLKASSVVWGNTSFSDTAISNYQYDSLTLSWNDLYRYTTSWEAKTSGISYFKINVYLYKALSETDSLGEYAIDKDSLISTDTLLMISNNDSSLIGYLYSDSINTDFSDYYPSTYSKRKSKNRIIIYAYDSLGSEIDSTVIHDYKVVYDKQYYNIIANKEIDFLSVSHSIDLSWKTLSENNITHFDIYNYYTHIGDTELTYIDDYTKIASVLSKGSINQQASYNLTIDSIPLDVVNGGFIIVPNDSGNPIDSISPLSEYCYCNFTSINSSSGLSIEGFSDTVICDPKVQLNAPPSIVSIDCYTDSYWATTIENYKIGYALNGSLLASGVLFMNTIRIAVFDPTSMKPWGTPANGENLDHYFGEINYQGNPNLWYNSINSPQYAFEFFCGDSLNRSYIKNMMDSVPNGYYVLLYVYKDFNNFSQWEPNVLKAFTDLGANSITSIPDKYPYILFAQKGNPSFAKEVSLGNVWKDSIISLHVEIPVPNNCIYEWYPPYAFNDPHSSSPIITNDSTRTYKLMITDTVLGYIKLDSLTVNACSGQVWPGDANANGEVNNFDIFPIGIAYGDTGLIRPNATENWIAQPAPLWDDTLVDGTNYMHIDCNGDAFIDVLDLNAILLNYNSTTSNKTSLQANTSDPLLYFSGIPDTMYPGQKIKVGLYLGTSLQPAQDIYGVAFSVYYNPLYVEKDSISISFDSCWVGEIGKNMISLSKNIYDSGRMDIGLSRTDLQTVSGFGHIGDLNIILEDDISGKKTLMLDFGLHYDNVRAGNSKIIYTPLRTDSITSQIEAGINKTNPLKNVSVYPSPAKDNVSIFFGHNPISNISLYSITGNELINIKTEDKERITLDISIYSSGMYYIILYSDNGIRNIQLPIIK